MPSWPWFERDEEGRLAVFEVRSRYWVIGDENTEVVVTHRFERVD